MSLIFRSNQFCNLRYRKSLESQPKNWPKRNEKKNRRSCTINTHSKNQKPKKVQKKIIALTVFLYVICLREFFLYTFRNHFLCCWENKHTHTQPDAYAINLRKDLQCVWFGWCVFLIVCWVSFWVCVIALTVWLRTITE